MHQFVPTVCPISLYVIASVFFIITLSTSIASPTAKSPFIGITDRFSRVHSFNTHFMKLFNCSFYFILLLASAFQFNKIETPLLHFFLFRHIGLRFFPPTKLFTGVSVFKSHLIFSSRSFFFKLILSFAAENNHPSGTNERQADNALIYIQSMWSSLCTIKPKRWMLMQLFGAMEVKIHISRTWFAPNKKKIHPFSSETEKKRYKNESLWYSNKTNNLWMLFLVRLICGFDCGNLENCSIVAGFFVLYSAFFLLLFSNSFHCRPNDKHK